MIGLIDRYMVGERGPHLPVMTYTIDEEEEAEEPPDPDSWQDGSDQPMPHELADDERY